MATPRLERFDGFDGAPNAQRSDFLFDQSYDREWQFVTADSARGMASIPVDWLTQVRATRRSGLSSRNGQQMMMAQQGLTEAECEEIAAAVEARLVLLQGTQDVT